MVKIFISYRRDDSQYVTDSIYEQLITHFPEEDVFLDVDTIPLGVDFPDFLASEISKCDVVLVIIGTEWAQIMQQRANEPDDFVRIEVESALTQDKLVIPVLVKNAKMSNATLLPDKIQNLTRKNAARIRRNPDLSRDCKFIADEIKKLEPTTDEIEFSQKDSCDDPSKFASFLEKYMGHGLGVMIDLKSGNVCGGQIYLVNRQEVKLNNVTFLVEGSTFPIIPNFTVSLNEIAHIIYLPSNEDK